MAWLFVWLPLRVAAHPLPTVLAFCVYGSAVLVVAICFENRLLVSWQAVALTIPQLIFVTSAIVGGSRTAYLVDLNTSFEVRALSYFHFVMPAVCVYAVMKLGYDRRALPLQVATAAVVLAASSGALDVNLVASYGRLTMFLALVAICYLPAHFAFNGSLLRSPLRRVEG